MRAVLLLVATTLALLAVGRAGGEVGATLAVPVGSGVIVFSSFRDGKPWLYAVDADGSGLRKLTLAGAPGEIVPGLGSALAAWSPDGAKLAFLSNDSSLVVVVGGRSRRLARPVYGGLAWSPDSRTIAYKTGAAGLDAVDVVTGRHVALTRPRAGASDSTPEWSPDGGSFAFLRYAPNPPCGGCSGLYVQRRDGSGLRLLSGGQTSSVFFPPSWSPDGRRLAFLARDGLFVIDANGTGRRLLSRTPLVPLWSPRGDEIALFGYGRPGVFLVRPDGGRLRQVFATNRSLTTVLWAPDGRRLAVEVPSPSYFTSADVVLVDLAAGRSRRITQSWRYGYSVFLTQWHPSARSTKELPGVPASWAIPTDSIAAEDILKTREPVDQLVADGAQAAISYSTPRCLLEVWNPAETRPVRFPAGPCGQGGVSGPVHPFSDLALGGDRIAFPVFSHELGTNSRGIVSATRERPSLGAVSGLCPQPGAQKCIRPPLGDLKAQGSLFVFDTWEGPDFYCNLPCPPPKRNGGLWRLDGTEAVQIASSTGALTPLSIDAGRILIDHEDGTIDIRTADGNVVRSFSFNPALVRGALLQGHDLAVLTPTALEVTDADTGVFLRRWPLPGPDAELADLQDGIAVLVAGTDIHLLRAADGHDSVIPAPGKGPVLAQLEAAGLFYSYTADDPTYPGRVVFVPFDQLPLR